MAKTVSLLFTKQRSNFARGIYWVTGRKYTHVSIRLDDMGENFYSFCFKGFCQELPRYFRKEKTVVSALYQFEVDDDKYDKAKEILEQFVNNKKAYRYAWFGLIMCILHIPHKNENAYFCSQFVSELLTQTGIMKVKKRPHLCLPNNLEKDLKKHFPHLNPQYDMFG